MAEAELPPRVEQPGRRELIRRRRGGRAIDACKLAGELERRIVAENHHRTCERLRRRIEPGEPGTRHASDLRRGDLADPVDCLSGEADILGTQRPYELAEQE